MSFGKWLGLASRRKSVVGLVGLMGLLPLGASAELVLAVSEGTSGGGAGVTDAQMATKYKPLVEVMEKVLKDSVQVRYVRSFAKLEQGMRDGSFDLVIARPSDYPARGVRDHGFSAVTTTLPDGHCLLVVRKDAPFKTLQDIQGKPLILPEESAYMTKFCLAELRDQGIKPSKIHHVREQAAIPFSVSKHLVDYGGIASYSGAAKRLEAEGLRVLFQSRPKPFLPLVAGRRVSPEQVQALRAAMTELQATEQGAAALSAIGLKAFDTDPQQRLIALLNWLEGKAAAN
ncbi:MAG: PhnD/SsuA/transferrin family substrate-binding protein [Burkholderiaceae bacterium]